jgi:checkpoint serine/threonine-protein kinase
MQTLGRNDIISSNPPKPRTVTLNPRTGKPESVFVDLEAVYPSGTEQGGEEFCFEELRARYRGWMDKDWAKPKSNPVKVHPREDSEATCRLDLPIRDRDSQTEDELPDHQPMVPEARPVVRTVPLKDESVSEKQARKEEKANRTRKIHVMEVRAETQTSKSTVTADER